MKLRTFSLISLLAASSLASANPIKAPAIALATAYIAGMKGISTLQLKTTHEEVEDVSNPGEANWTFNIHNEDENCFVTIQREPLEVIQGFCEP